MLRELAISIYLIIFKCIFALCKRAKMQYKTTFVASFGGNIQDIMQALRKEHPEHPFVVLKTNNCMVNFELPQKNILYFESKNIIHFVRSIYHLATSSHIIVDNYYGFLAVTDFKDDATCVQVWHAAGAIKQFGLEDLSNVNRTSKAMDRFKAVYHRFDQVIVGSDEMIDIYKRSFELPQERYVKTGIPRTDFFYNVTEKQNAISTLKKEFPIINDKKVILYAPTYRDNELSKAHIQLDIKKLYDAFKYEYVILLRLHPAVSGNFENKYHGFIYNVSGYHSINELLTITDILITDYSSIPFEYSILNRPMIFYAYDLEEYAKERGLWKDYIDRVPGPVVQTMDELVRVLKNKDFQLEKVQPFAMSWNQYSNGNSAKNFVEYFYK